MAELLAGLTEDRGEGFSPPGPRQGPPARQGSR
jgi:hypothetical protein